MKIWLFLASFAPLAPAQIHSDAVRDAMRQSIERQLASVERQRAAIRSSAPEPAIAAAATCDPLPESALAPLIAEAARDQGVEPALMREVARRESGFRPCAVSEKGALGIMQLMPETADALAVRDVFDVRENLAAGGRFLRQLLDRYEGDIERALSAYNAGPGRVDRAGGVPPIRETRDYVRSILARLPTL